MRKRPAGRTACRDSSSTAPGASGMANCARVGDRWANVVVGGDVFYGGPCRAGVRPVPGGRPMKRWLAGALVALAGDCVLVAVMVPLRPHLSIATCALVLVVPVVAGVAVGGL